MANVNDPPILFVKPRAISKVDKAILKEAGVIVIEVANPADVKFTRAHAEISGSALLTAALRAISTNTYASASISKFGALIIEAFLADTNQKVVRNQ